MDSLLLFCYPFNKENLYDISRFIAKIYLTFLSLDCWSKFCHFYLLYKDTGHCTHAQITDIIGIISISTPVIHAMTLLLTPYQCQPVSVTGEIYRNSNISKPAPSPDIVSTRWPVAYHIAKYILSTLGGHLVAMGLPSKLCDLYEKSVSTLQFQVVNI